MTTEIIPFHNEDVQTDMIYIETDTYAGNFERQMCAYLTSATSEYDSGHTEWIDGGFEAYPEGLRYAVGLYTSESDILIACSGAHYNGNPNTVVIFINLEEFDEEYQKFVEERLKSWPEYYARQEGYEMKILSYGIASQVVNIERNHAEGFNDTRDMENVENG